MDTTNFMYYWQPKPIGTLQSLPHLWAKAAIEHYHELDLSTWTQLDMCKVGQLQQT